MRKYQSHFAGWHFTAPTDVCVQYASSTSSPAKSYAKAARHLLVGSARYPSGVGCAFDLFPDLTVVLKRLPADGVAHDWSRVGRDLEKAMEAWRTLKAKPEAERDVA